MSIEGSSTPSRRSATCSTGTWPTICADRNYPSAKAAPGGSPSGSSGRLQTSPDGLLHEWWLPPTVRRLFASLAMFDPDVARAFLDGRVYEGLDHAEALSRVRCSMLVLHADWHRFAAHGLVGAMDDDDAARIRRLAPGSRYERVHANHVIHRYRRRRFVRALTQFAQAPPQQSR